MNPPNDTPHAAPFLESLEPRLLLSKAGFPDLIVENLSVPAAAESGSSVQVEYDVTNRGDTPFPAYGADVIYCSRSRRPRWTELPQAYPVHASDIQPGASVHVVEDISLPSGVTGRRFVVVTANPFEMYDEGRQIRNNTAFALITLQPPPPADLVPVNLAAGHMMLGESADIQCTIRNDGPAVAKGGWEDSVYLSSNSRLDKKDILLTRQAHPADLPVGQDYTISISAVVPPEALGAKYLIVVVDSTGVVHETTGGERNNVLAVPTVVEGFRISDLYSGAFLPRSSANRLTIDSFTGGPGSVLDLCLTDYEALPLLPAGAVGDVWLVADLPIAAGLNKRGRLEIDTSGLPHGSYTLTATMKQDGVAVAEQTFRITLVDDVLRRTDRLGDTVGGDPYEVFNLEVGTAGDTLLFRLGTNYGEGDADFRLRVGRARTGPNVFGIAGGTRETAGGHTLTEGALYGGAVFAPGEVVPRYLSLIDTYSQELFGESFMQCLDHSGPEAWDYDLFGGVQLSALGSDVSRGVTLSWSMYCGNDYIEVPYKRSTGVSEWITKNVRDPELADLLTQVVTDDYQLSRTEMIALLREAGQDDGAVDRTELADLKAILKNAEYLGMPDYVRVLAEKVVNGDRANRMRPGSGEETVEDLIQKWFYGADRPETQYEYRRVEGELFQDGPLAQDVEDLIKYEDVRQGELADCYLMAAAAEVAYRSPQSIWNMFTDNGDGTYTVRLYTARGLDYVTVDSYLPTDSQGNLVYASYRDYYGNATNELWVPLLEKAFAQVARDNSYDAIAWGSIYGTIQNVAGDRTRSYRLGRTSDSVVEAFDAGEMIAFATKKKGEIVNPDIAADHGYALVGYDPVSQTFTLYNPWGMNASKPGLVDLTWDELRQDFSVWGRTMAPPPLTLVLV